MPRKTRKQKIKSVRRRSTPKHTMPRPEKLPHHNPEKPVRPMKKTTDPELSAQDLKEREHFFADFRKSMIITFIIFALILIAKYFNLESLLRSYGL